MMQFVLQPRGAPCRVQTARVREGLPRIPQKANNVPHVREREPGLIQAHAQGVTELAK